MRFFVLIILTCSLLFSWCGLTYADLSGSLEWDYGEYHADEDGAQSFDSSYFAQRYSLLFSHRGTIMGGRGGDYDIALGGEWLGLNNDINNNGVNTEDKLSTSKLLYLGELNFAPGGLPFSLTMYSRDMSPSSMRKARYFLGTFDNVVLGLPRQTVLTPNIVTDIYNGTRHETGVSMVVGIRNGSYMGRYRNVLSHLPKLYFDYREMQVKDLNARTPSHWNERDLALVSLNKNDNWFHYRFYELENFLQPMNSFSESTYLLGSIDQNLRRQWINITNWIQLSTDGRYTQWHNRTRSLGDESIYALNLFFKTFRQNWRSSFLSNYSRVEWTNRLERRLNVPFFASGEPDRNNSWRFRLLGTRELYNAPFAVVNTESSVDDVYTTLRWETGLTSQYVSSPLVEVEGKSGDRGQGGAVRATYEFYSNKSSAKAGPYDLFSRIGVAYFKGQPGNFSGVTPYSDTDLFEVNGRFDLAKQLSSRLRTGFGSLLLLGQGEAETSVTDYIRPLSLERLKASINRLNVRIDGTVWRLEALWFMEHITPSRISNRLETGIEYQDFQSDTIGQYYLEHRLRYSTRSYLVNIESKLFYGDSLYLPVQILGTGMGFAQAEFDGTSFSNSSSLSYTPNRGHQLSGKAAFDWRLPENGNDGGRIYLLQEYRYSRYLQRGITRRLFEINQYLDYERFDTGVSVYDAMSLTGLLNYYPTAWSRLGCKVRSVNYIERSSIDTGFGLYSDINFSLLSVGLEYEYGMRTADNAGMVLDRDEQRWSISIRKTF